MNVIFGSNEIIDIILSKTQRKTPTIIHKHFSIQRIRQFYIKKLNFINQKFDFHIKVILEKFPIIDQIELFYKDLLNILFNRNYYKIALSRLNNSRNIVFKIVKNYIKLIKFGNSFYDCKQLKKAAIGRICTIIKKLNDTFIYLEKIRKQIKSLPLIDPYRKTILICGSGNCGKSSLLNKITKGNVEVNSSIFTTKSLQIGHFYKDFVRWQVIDTPGLHSTIVSKYSSLEMQTVNSIVHLECTLLYIFDPSIKSKTNLYNQIDILISILSIDNYKKKIFLLGKTDLEWEISKNRIKKTLLCNIIKKNFDTSCLLKISCHDEIGFFSLNHKICILKKKEKKKHIEKNNFHLNSQNISNCNLTNINCLFFQRKLHENINYINFKPESKNLIVLKKFSENNYIKDCNSNGLKIIETEEKIREFIYEEKYVVSQLKKNKMNKNIENNLKITPKNSLVSDKNNFIYF